MTTLIRRRPRPLGAGSLIQVDPAMQERLRQSVSRPTSSSGAPITIQSGVPLSVAERIRRITRPDAMFRVDASWASRASVVDGRLCIAGEETRSWDRTCGGDPICNWAFLGIETPCDPQTWANVMFQSVRYIWCQQELADLLANKPSLAPQMNNLPSANAWADWCIKIMRVVSMARWAVNAHPRYLVPLNEMPNARAAKVEILRYKPGAQPSRVHPGDDIEAQDAFTLTMAAPKGWVVMPGRTFDVPTGAADFNPTWIAQHQALSGTAKPWPWERNSGRSPLNYGTGTVGHSRVRDALVEWFRISLSSSRGSGYWWSGRNVRANVVGTEGCGIGPAAYCPRSLTGLRHQWGSGAAQVRMCEAWAQDVIDTSFGQIVSQSLNNFITAYENVDPRFRSLTDSALADTRRAITAVMVNEISGAIGAVAGSLGTIAGAINPAAGAMIAIYAAVVTAVLQIAQAFNAVAYGGGEMDRACIPPPVLRQIPSASTQACDFNTRDGQIERVAAQVINVSAAAERDLPVDVWFEASRAGAGEESSLDPDTGDEIPGGDDASGTNLLILGAVGLGVLGLVGYAATQKD